ncbi:MAG TPA: ATP-dependent Clp protease ATP-binding subunit [Ktedonosporobacter sp.]|nr:ATP-dependent Clp protease ATP-binding subunit [Ktedonosporobacter sp.]
MMSRLNKYTDEVRLALSFAREEARRLRHRLVGPEHLLLGILKLQNSLIEGLFLSLHTSPGSICQAIDFVIGHGNKALLSEPALNPAARAIMTRAEEEAEAAQAQRIDIEHVFFSLLRERDGVVMGVLESFGIYADAARQQLESLLQGGWESLRRSVEYQARYHATPLLNQISRDLTLAALNGLLDPMIGRETELERTMQILSRRTKNNPVLIGAAGVGKTAIAEGLALRILQGQVPENLLNCRIVALDTSLISVGTKFRGDLEERLARIMQEIINASGVIVVIDELHSLVQTSGADGSLDTANLFKPMLARGEFQCIGATTLDEYRNMIEADPALERRFQPVLVQETSTGETLNILHGLRSRYEDFHQVKISDEALTAAVQMSSRYIQSRCQPDKALDLLDEASSHLRVRRSIAPEQVRHLRDEIVALQHEKEYAIVHVNFPLAAQLLKRERRLRHVLLQAEQEWRDNYQQECPMLNVQDIAHVVAMWTGIPVVQIVEEEGQRLLNLEQDLHQRIIGQHEAVQAVARAIRRSRTGVRDGRRPIGSFIFVGPTGVGKTELARALAATLFGDENALLKLDMSEFMESHHLSRLLGAPPGYVGYDQAGQLTEAVRRRPYSVVLFDEVEKAHPKVFDILLQILEDGCLTDSHGVKVDFKHTVIIITSNVGTAQIRQGSMEFVTKRRSKQERQALDYERMRTQILAALKDVFRPELLNRLDETIVFHALEPAHLRHIVDLLIEQVQQRLLAQSIELAVSEQARLLLVERGYDQEYGARFLRRTVQNLLEDMLAEMILLGTLKMGNTVVVDAVGDTLTPCVSIHALPLAG